MNQDNNIHLNGLLTVVGKWKKFIALFVLITTLIASLFSFFILPKQYYAGTTLLPVNSMLTDKARIFNSNIQELYSVYGNADDLDRIYTIAKAGNVLGFIVDSLKLVSHFNIDAANEAGRTKAVARLKENVSIIKTENGALQIDVWDKNANIAAAIANLIVYKTEMLGNEMLGEINKEVADRLTADVAVKEKMLKTDTISQITADILKEEVERNTKILNEFTLAASVKQPSVVVLEKAYPSIKADRPKHWLIIVSALLLSLFFAILTAIVLNRVKK